MEAAFAYHGKKAVNRFEMARPRDVFADSRKTIVIGRNGGHHNYPLRFLDRVGAALAAQQHEVLRIAARLPEHQDGMTSNILCSVSETNGLSSGPAVQVMEITDKRAVVCLITFRFRLTVRNSPVCEPVDPPKAALRNWVDSTQVCCLASDNDGQNQNRRSG